MKKEIIMIERPGQYQEVLELNKPGEEKEISIVIKAMEEGDYILRTLTDHRSENSTGRVEVRGVVKNGARVRVDGMIKIQEGARMSDSFLKMKLLILDNQSSAIAEPKLEIENNEVKASHAATVGMIDEEQLMYLMSRGMDRAEAEKLIVEGFIK